MSDPEPSPASRLMVLMFTDVVGSTDMKRRLGDAVYARLINRHDALFKRIVAATPDAEILKDVGDGFLARFAAPSDAVNAALRFQHGLHRGDWQPERIAVRVGLHLGEVTEIDEDHEGRRKVVGLPADIAARVMSLAQGGQVLLTRAAFDSARQNIRSHPSIRDVAPETVTPTGTTPPPPDIRWMAYGRYAIKGTEEPIEIFEVGAEGISSFTSPPDNEKARRSYSPEEEATLGWRPAAGLPIPRRAGWSLDRKLGEGGFGEVWLGRHVQTLDQRVFKFCFDVERLRSFKRELTLFRLIRHALGDRKDIAKLHEVQLESAPYFLESEFSELGDLVEWSRSIGGIDKLPMAERLDMIARLADAVAAAHSVGVLHKDIKPSNVLIRREEGGQVRPVLADFGIGVVTDDRRISDLGITTGSGFTEAVVAGDEASRTGTRMYAPPESLTGKPFTVQGDVYALGVLLYQVVAGELDRPLAAGWERDVEDELVREDIAAAVAGDPSRRLASAVELAARLRALPERRLRRREEALAVEASARRQRRRRLVLVGVVLLGTAAAALGVGLLRERGLRDRAVAAEGVAEQAARRAASLSAFFRAMLESANPNNAKTGEVGVKQLLDEAADGVQQRFPSDPVARAEILHTLGVTYGALGQWVASEKQLASAVALRRANLGEKHPDTLASMHHHALALATLTRPTEAIAEKRRVVALREEVLGPKHRDTLTSMDSLAQSLYHAGERAEAARLRHEVLEARRAAFGEEDPDTLASMFGLATFATSEKNYTEARALLERVLEVRVRVLGEQHGDTLASRASLARVLSALGMHAEAEATLNHLVELYTKRFGNDHLTTLSTRITLASTILEAKRPAEAEAMLREVLLIQSKGELPADHWATLRARQILGDALASQDRFAEAETTYRDVLAARLKLPGGERSRGTVDTLRALASVLGKTGREDEAKALRAQADAAGTPQPPR